MPFVPVPGQDLDFEQQKKNAVFFCVQLFVWYTRYVTTRLSNH